MIVFSYDQTFEGLLCCVFAAYERHRFPDQLLAEGDILPLIVTEHIPVYTNQQQAQRVFSALQKKLSSEALDMLHRCWYTELPDIDLRIFHYIQKTIDSPCSIEVNFGDPDVLELTKIWQKFNRERSRFIQFLRFQKTADGLFFGAMEPLYNVIPFTLDHFRDRFADQRWIIYDLRRDFGFYYDLKTIEEVQFPEAGNPFRQGRLSPEQQDPDEQLFQKLWQTYYQSVAIQQRINPKLHRQWLPVRFWKYLPEKQGAIPPKGPKHEGH